MDAIGDHNILGICWKGAFGSFMKIRPTLSASHWLELVCTQNAAIMFLLEKSRDSI